MLVKRFSDLTESELSFLFERRVNIDEVTPHVEKIISDVKKNGDSAVIAYTKKFDGVEIEKIEVSEEEIEKAKEKVSDRGKKLIKIVSERIKEFHQKQKKDLWLCEFSPGITLGQKFSPLERVGVYVPASYPSTALMCVIPAKVSGVGEVLGCSPPRKDGDIDPLTLFALDHAGCDRIFRVGGVQAIAALAYGTETIPRVEKIVGPGNVYVTAAKKILRKEVEIDFPAGPSEILILSDESGDPEIIAWDMLAQAEHDENARSVLVTPSERLVEEVKGRIPEEKRFAIIIVDGIEEGIEFVNRYAPEHLEIHSKNSFEILQRIRNAGCIFLGKYSPVAAGDYGCGTNHVLPTAGYSRIFSGLDTLHFMKRISVCMLEKGGLESIGEIIVGMARAEGFEAHAVSVEKRLEEK
ncbi:MAG: histidinol dehydrogenase [Candidatus Syntropharchaeia archaeon]